MIGDKEPGLEAGERQLKLTQLQASMLLQAQQQLATAQAQLQLIASTILAGFGIQQAEIVRISGGVEPTLVIRQGPVP